MKKERLKFDPLNKEYKSVRGAVAVDTEVLFNIEIADDFYENGVFFVLYDYKTHTEVHRVQMTSESQAKGYKKYSAVLSIDQIGIYYYLFYLEGVCYEPWIGLTEQCKPGLFYGNPIGWQLSVYSLSYSPPEWQKGKIMYHIFVDRFYNVGGFYFREGAVIRPDWGNLPEYRPDPISGEILNNDFFGGNLRGIIAKLDYLKSLNVGIIILSPIFEAYSNHKYDTGDYMKIDEMFGTEELFVQLTREAEGRDIKIILDGVFNHTGADSIYFDKYNRYKQGGAYQKKNSVYADWYHFINWNDRYACWWNFVTMPTLNGDSVGLREFFCGQNGVVRKWLRLGASGWRLDVADELKNSMLESIVEAAKNEKEDALIIGEVWEDASNKYSYGKLREYFQGKQLDSVMNYPLRNAIIRFIRYGDEKELDRVNFELHNNYPKHVIDALMNILGTHDTARIITELVGDPKSEATREEKSKSRLSFEEYQKGRIYLKLAAVLQFTLSGFPCIYYGDEVGVQGCNDPFNRTCFPWNSGDAVITDFYRLLGEIRKEQVFIDGLFTCLICEKGFYCFKRESKNDCVIVAVNRSSEEKRIPIQAYATDLLSGERWRGQAAVQCDSAVILKLD